MNDKLWEIEGKDEYGWHEIWVRRNESKPNEMRSVVATVKDLEVARHICDVHNAVVLKMIALPESSF